MTERFAIRPTSGKGVSPAAKWVLAIVGLLGANFAAMIVLVASANHGSSRVVPSYYDPALRYESALDQATRNRALGWSVDLAIVDGIVTLTAQDASGSPLVGAHVTIAGTYRSGGEPIAGALVERGAGQYIGEIAGAAGVVDRSGSAKARSTPSVPRWVDVSIAVERDGKRFAHEMAVLAQ